MPVTPSKVLSERPPWIPAGRYDELRLAAFQQAEVEQRRRLAESSRGLRMTGAVAVVVGGFALGLALWFKEGGTVIAMTLALIAGGLIALRSRQTPEHDIRRNAEQILARALDTYHQNQLASTDFFHSEGWQALRRSTLETGEPRCAQCGRKASAMLVVEHIKSRAEAPQLALDPDNIRILCHACRTGRSVGTGTD